MNKAVVGFALCLLMGVGSLTLVGSFWGTYAESLSLLLVGLGLTASSRVLSMKRGPQPQLKGKLF